MVKNLRNFCIIAHIDHGKSTLADRFIERLGTISSREFREQMLDAMDIERERGITIKASAVRLSLKRGENEYILNLIDTPGHVDFSYEVSRSLRACEGVVLVVDAAQGVEAQTVSNMFLALENNLEVIPVINKIDLKNARVEEVTEELVRVLGVKREEILSVSAKTGVGVEELFDTIVSKIPQPRGDDKSALQALVFDSVFDDYKGVIVYLRLMGGILSTGQKIRMLGTGNVYEVAEVGVFTPEMQKVDSLHAGEVGYFTASIKRLSDIVVGDTVALQNSDVELLPGYREPQPMVFCGLYPAAMTEYESLRRALYKLQLNDSSFKFEPEKSEALGLGFRCGFLGLLHMAVIQERLERESNIDVVQTAPSTSFEVVLKDGGVVRVDNAAKLPPAANIEEFREPLVEVNLIIPSDSIGAVMKLCEDRRGEYKSTTYLSPKRVFLTYHLPLAEIIYDFFDRLKSLTRGYGTMDYSLIGYRISDLVKLDILVAEQKVDALSRIVHKSEAERIGRKIIKTLRKEIPKHLFVIALQVAVGSRVIARENISALAKNVTAKCYGGDISRKRKLLEKQKEGKKRMKQVGRVSIPQNAFLAALSKEG
ncbi:MAG: translation elongation factor 4 [Planctomycetota bacterium]